MGLPGYNLFVYCGNVPVSRIDISGNDSDTCEDVDDCLYPETFESAGKVPASPTDSDGTGSMIGDIAYIDSKSANMVPPIFSLWDWFCSLFSRKSKTEPQKNTQTAQETPQHTTSKTSPRSISNPGGSHTQMGDNGKIYSYTQYDMSGRQTLRIDFQGRPHNRTLPHIHLFVYLERGGKTEYIFDLDWHLID